MHPVDLRRPPKSDSKIPTSNKYEGLDTEADDGVHQTQNTQTHFPDKMTELLQWNICGLQENREELDMLLSQTHNLCYLSPRNFRNDEQQYMCGQWQGGGRARHAASLMMNDSMCVSSLPVSPHRGKLPEMELHQFS